MTETVEQTPQSLAAEDAIVEIAGRSGTSKKYSSDLSLVANFDPSKATDEEKMAMTRLQNEFGRFTGLVLETWNAPANVTKRAKASRNS